MITKIAVVGDVVIDENYQIEANRISPEFPIPVMVSESDTPQQLPGGAANVAYLLLNFKNVYPTLVSLFDPEANKIFNEVGLTNEHLCCVVNKDYKVPRKKRFYNGEFPLCRWDVEKNFTDEEARKSLLEILERHIQPNVVVLSDYNKGFFKNGKKMWMNKKWTTIVDPKNGTLEEWRGCDVFKPNYKEAIELTGETEWKKQLKIIMRETECKLAIITHGSSYYAAYKHPQAIHFWEQHHKSSYAKYPIGAGDCFAAGLAMYYEENAKSMLVILEKAYKLGEVYVKSNKRLITPEDLLETKIIKNPEVLKKRNFTLAFCNGCWDILHNQHIELLKFAKTKADKLVVAINSDQSVKQLKGKKRPIVPLEHRMAVMEAIECVDFVVSFDENTPLDLIKKINPDCIVKGSEYAKEDVVGYKEIHGNVILFPYKEGVSTTSFLKTT